MTRFQPKGEKAQWRMCVDLVLARELNDTVYYAEVEELLDCDRITAQRAMRDARTYLLEQGADLFPDTAQQTGWVVKGHPDRLPYADRVVDKAMNQVKGAASALRGCDREQLEQGQREKLDRDLFRLNAVGGVLTNKRFAFDQPPQLRQVG